MISLFGFAGRLLARAFVRLFEYEFSQSNEGRLEQHRKQKRYHKRGHYGAIGGHTLKQQFQSHSFKIITLNFLTISEMDIIIPLSEPSAIMVTTRGFKRYAQYVRRPRGTHPLNDSIFSRSPKQIFINEIVCPESFIKYLLAFPVETATTNHPIPTPHKVLDTAM